MARTVKVTASDPSRGMTAGEMRAALDGIPDKQAARRDWRIYRYGLVTGLCLATTAFAVGYFVIVTLT